MSEHIFEIFFKLHFALVLEIYIYIYKMYYERNIRYLADSNLENLYTLYYICHLILIRIFEARFNLKQQSALKITAMITLILHTMRTML